MNSIAKPKNLHLYSADIEVFTDADGYLQIIAIGSGDNSTPRIVRLNHRLELQWQATVPKRLSKLAMLKLQNAAFTPLFMAISEEGAFYVFDSAGTLLYQDYLFEPGEKDSAVYWLEGVSVNDNTGYVIRLTRVSGSMGLKPRDGRIVERRSARNPISETVNQGSRE